MQQLSTYPMVFSMSAVKRKLTKNIFGKDLKGQHNYYSFSVLSILKCGYFNQQGWVGLSSHATGMLRPQHVARLKHGVLPL